MVTVAANEWQMILSCTLGDIILFDVGSPQSEANIIITTDCECLYVCLCPLVAKAN